MDFVVNRTNLKESKIQLKQNNQLKTNQVLAQIQKFAFTTNNITYAVSGNHPLFNYFDFFPAQQNPEKFGIIPTWGLATISDSNHPDIKKGEKLYGYFPMSNQVVLEVSKCTKTQFFDFSGKRKELSLVYNTYERLNSGQDPFYEKNSENEMMIWRPLFLTSWLLQDLVQDMKAQNVYITSASSKTSYLLAFLLKQKSNKVKVIGFTSKRNVQFTNSLQIYDDVIEYNNTEILGNDQNGVIVDMMGNGEFLNKVSAQLQLNDQKQQVILVGATDYSKKMKGLNGTFFFAPSQAKKAVKKLGGNENFSRITAQDYFECLKQNQTLKWLVIEGKSGVEQVQETYYKFLGGKGIDPRRGVVLSLDQLQNQKPKL